MIADAPLEYAWARLSARLASRPDERLWRQLRSARSLQSALDVVRGSPAAPYVAGIAMGGTIDSTELAFRQHLRARIREAADWAPGLWRAAVLWTEALPDLPALQRLLSDERPPIWLRADPQLAGYVAPERAARRALIAQGPLGGLVAAAEVVALQKAKPRAAVGLHPLLQTWSQQWQRRWPECSGDQQVALQSLLRSVRTHLQVFAHLPVELASAARASLAERVQRLLHSAPAQPVALFAYLLLIALDIERLRGEFTLRAAAPALVAEALP